jgi:hypothetical protein
VTLITHWLSFCSGKRESRTQTGRVRFFASAHFHLTHEFLSSLDGEKLSLWAESLEKPKPQGGQIEPAYRCAKISDGCRLSRNGRSCRSFNSYL